MPEFTKEDLMSMYAPCKFLIERDDKSGTHVEITGSPEAIVFTMARALRKLPDAKHMVEIALKSMVDLEDVYARLDNESPMINLNSN